MITPLPSQTTTPSDSSDEKQKSTKSRIHYLDDLRALTMLNVVFGHATMSFAVKAPSGWAALDRSRSIVFDLIIFLIASHAMQLFFFLAGFFSMLVVQKKGNATFAISRWKRIVVPFLLSVVTVLPLLQVVGLYGTYEKATIPKSGSFRDSVIAYFTRGVRFSELNWGHLWFLLYLILITALFILALTVVKRLNINHLLDSLVKKVSQSPLKPLLLAVPTAILMQFMNWMIDTPSQLLPEWPIVAYYVFFYFTGVLFSRVSTSFLQPQPYWKLYLYLGLLVVAPATLGLMMRSSYEVDMRNSSFYVGAIVACALLTWLLIFGMIGLFQKRFSKPTKLISYLSEASLWIYIIHFPVVLYLQVVVMHWQWPVFLKFLFVSAVTWAVLVGSYEYLVRRTWLGVLLNGRKSMPVSSPGPDGGVPA